MEDGEEVKTDTQNQLDNLKDRIRISEKWTIYLTAAIAFFALCSVVVGMLQWNVMSDQWKVMNGQLAQMKASEDPYIEPESMTPGDFIKGKLPVLAVSFHNYGRGIATHVSGNVTLNLGLGPKDTSTTIDPSGNFTIPALPRVVEVISIGEALALTSTDCVVAPTLR